MARTTDELIVLITQWANARNLLLGSTPTKQQDKLYEEVGEVEAALEADDMVAFKDAIGDCFVVLTVMAAQCDYNIRDCIDAAYNEIKDRKGRMIDGIFVKEADLPENS